MLLLTSTADLLRLITDSAATVDVHASYMDYNGTIVVPNRTNTAIVSATTTTIVPSPSSGIQRNVKALYVRNKDGALSVTVVVLHTDGTTAVQLKSITLAPGEELQFLDELGFLVL